ncbi:hypothetical protein ACFQFC_10855 [Amorphoplanes digitatis]|uniref:Uncharacterized protein n=1 Tax=Actinoplanes digitatis TaxID=1868 RepID=A0A7W7I1G7_9ACTN|nr:hypothetical protein [Actinoplanes digitatis]MBB4764697.1 hypothetical protein [Actinoplanes digitatis]BFE74245.1 hypothetical protein GCM10020092_075460 [Actinoplanes digitatis]GID91351.1 hypothetical protein Adi01nite_07630 [Actinoplanes digitatis]
MGEFADRIDTMLVRASTPDGAIAGELRDRDRLTLTFRQGWYDLCDDHDLERRLAVLANLLWVSRTREYWRAFSDVTGQTVTGEDRPISARDVDWRAERDELVARGYSADGRISVKAVGMRQWEVHIAPGTVRGLSEHEFAAAAAQAAGELINHQFAQIAALSNKYYGYDR